MEIYPEGKLTNKNKNLFVERLKKMVENGVMECPAQKSHGEFIIYSPNGSIDGVCVFCYNLMGYGHLKEVTEYCPPTDIDSFITDDDPFCKAEQATTNWITLPED